MLLLRRAWVQSLVGEIKYHKLQSMAKKLSFLSKKKKSTRTDQDQSEQHD